MNKLRLGLLVSTLLFATGCEKGAMSIARTLQPSNPQKPTPQCKAADEAVTKILLGTKSFRGSSWFFTADGSCVVKVSLDGHNHVLPLVRKFRAATGFSTAILVGKQPVDLWLDEPAKHGGNSSFPSEEDCRIASASLSESFPRADVRALRMTNIPSGSLYCYVQAAFADDVDFEAFLSWKNPDFPGGDLFHFNRRRADESISTVWIHALVPIIQN